MWWCACAPAPAAYRGGAEHFPPFGRKPQTPDWPAPPQSGDSPRSGSPRPCEQSVPQLPSRPGVGLASMLRAIELARDEPSVPSQNGIRQSGSRYVAECLAAQSTTNLAELRSLGVRELRPTLQLASQDLVLSGKIFIPQQQLLVHRPADVGQDACPLHELPHLPAGSQWAPSIAPNNVTDNARRAHAEWHNSPTFIAVRIFWPYGIPRMRLKLDARASLLDDAAAPAQKILMRSTAAKRVPRSWAYSTGGRV